MTFTFGVVSFCLPKMVAKIEKNASGRTKLNTSAPRSRRKASNAVRAT
jgi:hypothetical protein